MREQLIQRQRELGMADRAFARYLGVGHRTWGKTRTGQLPLGRRVARAAAKRFPELADELARFLLEESGGVEVGA